MTRSVSLGALAAALTAVAWTAHASDGARLQSALDAGGHLDAYMHDVVDEVVLQLAQQARYWEYYGVNDPWDPRAVNVYVVRADGLPEKTLVEDDPLQLSRGTLVENALANPDSQSIFLDSGLLKRLAATAVLWSGPTELPLREAVPLVQSTARIEGLDRLRDLWDPERQADLESINTSPGRLFHGALAFILAHEMGHLVASPGENIDLHHELFIELSPRDRDLRWACPDLVLEETKAARLAESSADRFAVSLLSSIPTAAKTGLLYEMGTYWLLDYLLNATIIEIPQVNPSPRILRMIADRIGPNLYARVTDPRFAQARPIGMVQLVFPNRHPAVVQRMIEAARHLSASPDSAFQDEFGPEDAWIFDMLVERTCQEILSRTHQ